MMKQINHLRIKNVYDVVAQLHLHMKRQDVPSEAIAIIKNYVNDMGKCSMTDLDVQEMLWNSGSPILTTHCGTTQVWCKDDIINIAHIEPEISIE